MEQFTHQSRAKEKPGLGAWIQNHRPDLSQWTGCGPWPMLGLRPATEILGILPQALQHHTNSLVHHPTPLAQSLPSAEPTSEAAATEATGPGKVMPWHPSVRHGDGLFEQVQYH